MFSCPRSVFAKMSEMVLWLVLLVVVIVGVCGVIQMVRSVVLVIDFLLTCGVMVISIGYPVRVWVTVMMSHSGHVSYRLHCSSVGFTGSFDEIVMTDCFGHL